MPQKVDTLNWAAVGATTTGSVMFNPPLPMQIIDGDKALVLAAYLVLLSGKDYERWEEVYLAVEQA